MAGTTEGNYSAMGGIPTGVDVGGSNMSPDQWADFWARYKAAQEPAGRTSEMAKNVPAGMEGHVSPTTPGPEAFKQNPTTGGGDLADIDVGPEFANRAVMSALYPVAGLGQVGGYLGQQLASAGGYYPNAVSEYARQGKETSAKAADLINRANIEASRRAGYDTENFNIMHPIATAGSLDPANMLGGFASPANALPAGVGGRVGRAALSRFAGKAPAAIKGAELVGSGMGMGFGTELANPIMEGQVLPENATPEQRDQADRDFAMEKLKRLGISTALGGVLTPLASEAGAIVGGKVAPNVATLLKEKIPLSIGQTVGGDPYHSSMLGQAVNWMEGFGTGIPIAGLGLSGARARAQEGLQYAVAERALKKIGKEVPSGMETGRPLIDHTRDMFSDKYDDILPRTKAKLDAPFIQDIRALGQDPDTKLLAASGQTDKMQAILKYVYDMGNSGVSAPGTLEGQAVKNVQSKLTQWAGAFSRAPGPENQGMAHFIDTVKGVFLDSVERHTSGDVAKELAQTNAGYKTFKQMINAGGSIGADEGRFTAAQFARSVRKSDPSVDNGAYARGKAWNQDLSDAAKTVLRNERSSGTDERGGARHLAKMMVGGNFNPADLAGAVGTLGAYSRPGQWALRQLATNRLGMGKPLGALTEKSGYGALLASESPRGQEEIGKVTSPSPGLIASKAPDAETAGADFYHNPTDPSLVKRNMNAMTPSERAQFGDSFANKWLAHITGSVEPRAALNTLDTPEGRLKMDTALGPNRSRQLEAMTRIEGLQSLAPWAEKPENARMIGAPGALPTQDAFIANAINTGASLSGKKFKPEEVLRMSALLASKYPEHYEKGLRQVANSPMMDALRAYDRHLSTKITQGNFLQGPQDASVGAIAPGAMNARPVEGGALAAPGNIAAAVQGGGKLQDAREAFAPAAAASAPVAPTPPEKGAVQAPNGKWYKPSPNGKWLEWQGK